MGSGTKGITKKSKNKKGSQKDLVSRVPRGMKSLHDLRVAVSEFQQQTFLILSQLEQRVEYCEYLLFRKNAQFNVLRDVIDEKVLAGEEFDWNAKTEAELERLKKEARVVQQQQEEERIRQEAVAKAEKEELSEEEVRQAGEDAVLAFRASKEEQNGEPA